MTLESRDDFLARCEPIIVKQAHKQLKGSEILEVDDIAQEIRSHFIQKYNSIKGLEESGLSYIAYRAAATFCEKERTDYMYASGNFVYHGELVEYLLKEHAFAELDGDVDVEGRIDVQRALDSLTPRQREVTIRRYRDGAELSKTEQKSCERALRSITDFLNRGVNKSRVELNTASEEA